MSVVKFRTKTAVVEAVQWFKNGDHPEDECRTVNADGDHPFQSEGKVVRRFRLPHVSGSERCTWCSQTMHVHGWLDIVSDDEAGRIVCPGDWIVTHDNGERFPCIPDLFKQVYEPLIAKPCADCGNELGDAYYSDVPDVGNLCIGCHSRRFAPGGHLSTFDTDTKGIDDPDA